MEAPSTITTEKMVETSHVERVVDNERGLALVQSRPSRGTPTADPLSWKTWTKVFVTVSICMNVFACNFYGGGLVPTLVPVATELNVSIANASHLFSYNVLAQGLGNLIWVPLMVNLGKRHTMIITMVLFLPCIAWGASARTYGSLFASRIVGGFASGASESFGPAVIGDLWYEHELTTAIGCFTACLLSGAPLGQVVLGYVAQDAGWRWAYWITFILAALNTVLMIFYLPETSYARGTKVGVTAGDIERLILAGESEHKGESAVQGHGALPHVPAGPLRMRDNLWYIKHPYINYKNNWFLTFARPFIFALVPTVFWAAITYSFTVGCFTAIGVTTPQILSAAPYFFQPGAQGLFGLSGLIGIVLGGSGGAKLVDMFNFRIEKKRRARDQVHKPEERLIMMVIPFVTAPLGLVVYGDFIKHGYTWIGPAFAYGIHCFGLGLVASIAFSYAVDSYLPRSGEVMVFMNVCRCLVSFGIADVTPTWLIADGPLIVYGTLAGILWALLLIGIPMFYLGPWLRAKTNRYL